MFQQIPHAVFDYRLQGWGDVSKALLALINYKEKNMVSKGGLPMEKLYASYIEPIYALIAGKNEGDLSVIDKQLIGFLEANLVGEFLKQPSDPAFFNNLFAELLYIKSALIAPVGNPAPYSIRELKKFSQGEGGEYYDDLVYARTLRLALDDEEKLKEIAPIVMNWVRGEQPPIEAKFEWEESFLHALNMDVLWKGFLYLQEEDQEFLFKNCLYFSVILDSPVRESFHSFFGKIKTTNHIKEGLEKNAEGIVINTQTDEKKPLPVVLSNYMAFAAGDEMSGFNQDRFVSDMYSNQEYRDFYGAWLREVIAIGTRVQLS